MFNNLLVRRKMLELGLTQRALAHLLKRQESDISKLLKFELSKQSQLDLVREIEEACKGGNNDSSAN